MSEDKPSFLAVVGRAFGDDEVRHVSYVLGLEYDAYDVSSLSYDHVYIYIVYFVYRW